MAFNAYMHERNIYRNQPDFNQIALDYPEFRKYAIPDAKGQKVRVDFTNTEALRMLTKILLKKDFNLNVDIPEGFLIPTIPQRLNYILWVEDLLSNISRKDQISGIDIGTGPCAIFSILGAQKNKWKFIATESSEDAVPWALKNIDQNNLADSIKVVKVSQGSVLNEVLSLNEECYDFCLCNPPFFENIEEIRKKHKHSKETIADVAQKEEIFVKGGEMDFVKNILKDSLIYKDRICLFTSMFGKKKSLLQIVKEIKEIKDVKFTTTEFCQGNTVRWAIAWTFNESVHLEEEVKKKVKPKKVKPPLEYQIPLKNPKYDSLEAVVKQVTRFLQFLEIPFAQTRASKNFTELLLKSDKNTWTHQRRKRRELQRQKKRYGNLETEPSTEVALITKDQDTEGNIIPETETGVKHCTAENLVFNSETSQLTEPDGLILKDSESKELSQTLNESALSNNIKTLENNKRKGSFASDNLVVKKKSKFSVFEKTTNITDKCVNTDTFLKTETDNDLCIRNAPVDNHENEQKPSISKDISMSESDNYKVVSLNKAELHSSPTIENSLCTKADVDDKTQGLLHCNLQFIKGKSKIYVKMNCPPEANRNTMYQVFQLLKNKIN